MDTNTQARYRRWQDYRIGQLSTVINLFLGFAVASLAYAINLKLEDKGSANLPLDSTIAWWAVSALSGALATVSKLMDYRYTAQKILNRNRFNKWMASAYGVCTWVLFWAEAGTYSIGAVVFILGVLGS